jgi:hypothetical protein
MKPFYLALRGRKSSDCWVGFMARGFRWRSVTLSSRPPQANVDFKTRVFLLPVNGTGLPFAPPNACTGCLLHLTR